MTIRTQQVTLTPAGSAGSATANGQTGVISGEIMAVHLEYTSQPATTDVTIATANAPVNTILTITNAATDGWFYPRHVVHGETGTALTGTAGGDRTPVPVDDHIKVTIAQGDPVANGLVATILYKC